ncbi:MAG: YajQ family cyclic di-GMP-binding protein [Rickettsiales bacterium]|nr:YajQ family cyclic di-GMP-binding protein [Rickettsiales bacterium]|tara:strand:+ start:167 stop:652 length:486 start_codon:yes stop_codon:yes gene_type:complete
MPTFDVVSKTDLAEVDNAINGAMREISTRYDFKNSESKITRESDEIDLIAEDQYKIDQVQQIFRTHLVKRKLSSGAFNFSKVEDARGGMLRQKSKIIQGVDKEVAQLINKTIKNSKLKVQVAIRGDEIRVSGNKRDNLQSAIEMIKELGIKQPLQFINFRD